MTTAVARSEAEDAKAIERLAYLWQRMDHLIPPSSSDELKAVIAEVRDILEPFRPAKRGAK